MHFRPPDNKTQQGDDEIDRFPLRPLDSSSSNVSTFCLVEIETRLLWQYPVIRSNYDVGPQQK